MKLWFDRKSKDPTYFIQQGFRNGKKTSTRNVKRIGKHSELLAITDDPLAYAKEQVAKYNEEMKNTKVSMDLSIDFDKKVRALPMMSFPLLPCGTLAIITSNTFTTIFRSAAFSKMSLMTERLNSIRTL